MEKKKSLKKSRCEGSHGFLKWHYMQQVQIKAKNERASWYEERGYANRESVRGVLRSKLDYSCMQLGTC